MVVLGGGSLSYKRGTPVPQLAYTFVCGCAQGSTSFVKKGTKFTTSFLQDALQACSFFNCFTEMCSGSEGGPYSRLIDMCIRNSRLESNKEEEEGHQVHHLLPPGRSPDMLPNRARM